MTAAATALFRLLRDGVPHREVYHARDGGWFVTYSGGEVSADAVRELVQAGLVRSVYNNCPNDAYHVGRTIDIGRTTEARRLHGKKAPLIYVDDPIAALSQALTADKEGERNG